MSRFDLLHNREEGQRCVLVANGPSLNQMNLELLKHQTCIGLNKIFLGFKKFRFYPKYYVAINDLVIQQSASEIKMLNCVKFISRRNAHIVPESALTYHVNTTEPPARFCKDISLGLHEGWTVTYAALQVAFYLGFQEVIIIGLDHRYKYQGLPNESRMLQGDDPNHFTANYFGGQRWDNPDLSHSEESYRLARKIYEAEGRRIVDATLNGACTVFEKQPYTSVLKESF